MVVYTHDEFMKMIEEKKKSKKGKEKKEIEIKKKGSEKNGI